MFTPSKFLKLIDGDIGNSGDAYAWMNYHDPHIGESEKDVLKMFFRRCLEAPSAMKREKRLARLNAYRDVILRHRRNQTLYNSVMRGA